MTKWFNIRSATSWKWQNGSILGTRYLTIVMLFSLSKASLVNTFGIIIAKSEYNSDALKKLQESCSLRLTRMLCQAQLSCIELFALAQYPFQEISDLFFLLSKCRQKCWANHLLSNAKTLRVLAKLGQSCKLFFQLCFDGQLICSANFLVYLLSLFAQHICSAHLLSIFA